MRIARLIVFAWLPLSGCVAGVAAEAVSVGTTGKTLGDHALSATSGKDCKVLEGAVRSDRDVCEEPGSPATKRDAKGIAGTRETGSRDKSG